MLLKKMMMHQILLHDMIANNINPAVTELFIKVRKLNISTAFITHSYFKVL